MSSLRKTGFTLIELLVVIAIIGLLATIVMVSLNSARNKAKTAKSQADIQQFVQVAAIAQGEAGKTVLQITGNGCSDCPCRGLNKQNVADSDSCAINWYNVLSTIQSASGLAGLTQMKRDGWGAPYCIDENEWEFNNSDCRYDNVSSAGPDGICETADDVGYSYIPHVFCP